MTTIPTNARTAIRVQPPAGVELSAWTIEFVPSDVDLVRLFSVDGHPDVVLVETTDREGTFTLTCRLGLHGIDRDADGREFRREGRDAGVFQLAVDASAQQPEREIVFDLR